MSSLGFECVNVRYGAPRGASYALHRRRCGRASGCASSARTVPASRSVLRAVAGLVPYRGTITVDGAPLSMRSPRRRAALVAYVPQSPLMPDDMTGAEYVLLGRNPYVGYFGSRDQARPGAWWPTCSSGSTCTSSPTDALGTLSGGERQRLVIARAHRPGGADPAARRADQRARHRPPAAGARTGRPAAPRARPHRGVGDARPHPRRPVRRPPVAAAPGPRGGHAAAPRTCCAPRSSASSTASA